MYLTIGFHLSKQTKNIADMLPLKTGGLSVVKNSNEFSNSTVATTISLATVVLTFYELAPYFGFWWLLFPVITTSLGIYVVRLLAKPIWKKLKAYTYKPSLHEFLSVEYNSPNLALIGATATSLGFLGAFAVELTVGSRFLGALIPEIPQFVSVITLSLVAFIYTMKGGFRAVIVTDKLQMITIWLLLFVL
ncbi:MAG: hypothetical protein KDC67_14420, partial [Ignavibacteriae bacterium]|nr:hypothetical protein [Ignavibacteriota bacterium]